MERNGVLLDVTGLTVRFGGVTALEDVDLTVLAHSSHGIIGPNGAGKTTLFNCISRVVTPSAGRIIFRGQDLLQLRPYAIAGLGIGRTFQSLGLVEGLSVLENVMVGLHVQHSSGFLDEVLLIWRKWRAERAARRRAEEALELVGLAHLGERPVAGLPYGSRKLVEVARALVIRPRLLMLDEPTAGLNVGEIGQLQVRLQHVRRGTDLTMFIITHHVEFLLSIADTVTVLSLGHKIAEGKPQEVKGDPAVITAYLGEEEA